MKNNQKSKKYTTKRIHNKQIYKNKLNSRIGIKGHKKKN